MVLDKSGTLLSSILSEDLQKTPDLASTLNQYTSTMKNSTNKFITIGGTNYYLSFTNQNQNKWYLISLIPSNILFKDVLISSVIGALIMIGIILLSFAVSFSFARRLNRPIQVLTKIAHGQKVDVLPSKILNTEEFQFIISMFEAMREQNQQLDELKKETAYSLKQDFLNSLISGSNIHSLERTETKLRKLNLSYLLASPLCMCVFKIDQYNLFLSSNSQKERWALRFAIVNIAEEVSSSCFTCEIFSRENDKFIMLIQCDSNQDYKLFQKKLEMVLSDIQQNVKKCLDLSLSVAYSTLFQGLEHLPSMYSNMKNSLLLKLKYGHKCIITPYMMDDMNTDNFRLQVEKLEQFTAKILEGNQDATWQLYLRISEQLYLYSYNEIISGLIYITYSVYTRVFQKYALLKDGLSVNMKKFMTDLQNAEISEDLDQAMYLLITTICDKINAARNISSHQNIDFITQRVCEIINKKYSYNALCLSLIAEELGLSPNYIGQIFKNTMGKSVAQYILDFRMEKLAEYLKNSKLQLNNIIEKVGLEKNNYFYTKFKKHFGVSLGDYRQKLGQNGDE
jgi:YesN/AraC family two-component response regulator